MPRIYCCFLMVVLAGVHLSAKNISAQDFQPLQVAEGIYMLKGVHEQMSASNLGAISNTGFIVGSEAVAVIDPGGSPAAGLKLAQALESITELPVRYVVLTHFHPDHVAGSSAFPEATHFIAHEKYNRSLAQRAQFYLDRFEQVWSGDSDAVFKVATHSIAAGQTLEIDLGDRLLSVEAYPVAHSDNDLTVHDVLTNTLWASDLLFAQRTPSLDGSLNGWIEVLERLQSQSYDLVIPGHGDPGSWASVANRQMDYLPKLRDDTRDFLQHGVALSEVLNRHDANPVSAQKWLLFPEQHGSNLSKAYTELEWE